MNQEASIHEIPSYTTAMSGVVWQRGKLIGHGRFGKVFAGIALNTGKLFAIKQLKIQDSNFDDVDATYIASQELPLSKIEQEVNIGISLCHPHVVQYHGAQIHNNVFSIFMEYLPTGSISSVLKTIGPLDESIICVYVAQVLRGLNYLHTIGIAHRDIKCANLLLSDNGCVKIADFGTAKSSLLSPIDDQQEQEEAFATISSVREGIGTPFWMSPEIIRAEIGQDAWKKSDIWSVGCCVIEMATGDPPWNNFSNPLTAMFHIASKSTLPTLPDHLSASAHDFLSLCFIKDPSLRPTAADLLHHSFFHKLPRSSSHYGWFANEKPSPPAAQEQNANWCLYYDYWGNVYEHVYYVIDDGGSWIYRANGDWEWLPFASEVVYGIATWWLGQAREILSQTYQDFDASPLDASRDKLHEQLNDSTYTLTTPVPYSSQSELFHEDVLQVENTAYVRVLADYITNAEGELALQEHDVLLVHEMDSNGWWRGCSTANPSVEGWFPCTYVEWLSSHSNSEHIIGLARAVVPYFDESLSFELHPNQLIQVTELIDEQWLRGLTIDDSSIGWVPTNCVEWLPSVQATWAYDKSHEEELSLNPGDIVYVLGCDENSTVWWEGFSINTKQRGWFPSTHVQSENQVEVDSSDGEEDVVVVDHESFAL